MVAGDDRDFGLETERADLDDIAVAQQLVLDRLAVDARCTARAVANPPAAQRANDEAMDGSDLGGNEADVTTGRPPQHDDITLERSPFLPRRPAEDEKSGSPGIDLFL